MSRKICSWNTAHVISLPRYRFHPRVRWQNKLPAMGAHKMRNWRPRGLQDSYPGLSSLPNPLSARTFGKSYRSFLLYIFHRRIARSWLHAHVYVVNSPMLGVWFRRLLQILLFTYLVVPCALFETGLYPTADWYLQSREILHKGSENRCRKWLYYILQSCAASWVSPVAVWLILLQKFT